MTTGVRRLKPPRILLVNPWIVDFAAYDFWVKPIGLLMIGRVLSDHGFRTTLLDCLDRQHPALSKHPLKPSKPRPDGTGHFFKETIPKQDVFRSVPRRYGRYGLPFEIVRSLLKQTPRPDAILVTSGMTFWYPGVQQMIQLLREIYPGVPVALGGIYATLCPDHARQSSGADRVIAGEGETAALQLLKVWTGFGPENPDPAPFPLPDYDLYPALESAALLTSRGCPYHCPFCATHLLTGAHRRLDPETVLAFLRDLSRRGVRHVAFYDDALLVRKEEHLIPLLEEVSKFGLKMRFHTPNGIHPRMIDPTLADLMSRSGFETIRLSYESRNPERQKEMGFKVTDDDLAQAVRQLVQAGVEKRCLGAYVLMGLPDQGLEEALDSIHYVFSLGIRVSVSSFSPIPGTQSWEDAVRKGLLSADADPLVTNSSVYPLKSDAVPYAAFLKLGTLAAEGNRLILEGRSPEKDVDYRGKVRDYIQTFKLSIQKVKS